MGRSAGEVVDAPAGAAEGGINVGYNTKIDWCDTSWNPVTGCLHGCEYCYARRIANRFGGSIRLDLPPDTSWRANRDESEELKKTLMGDFACHSNGGLHILDEPALNVPVYPAPPSEIEKRSAPYPYYFDPTFHRYKLDQPQKWTKPRTIFVCSMADLFGEWVPDGWIEEVFKACEAAPWHRYLFLTKNPVRYNRLYRLDLPYLNGAMFGYTLDATQTNEWLEETKLPYGKDVFVSIEPIQGEINSYYLDHILKCGWVIVGAETGNRKGIIKPKKEWIDFILRHCEANKIPIFMKESIRGLMGDDFRQEFPWGGEER